MTENDTTATAIRLATAVRAKWSNLSFCIFCFACPSDGHDVLCAYRLTFVGISPDVSHVLGLAIAIIRFDYEVCAYVWARTWCKVCNFILNRKHSLGPPHFLVASLFRYAPLNMECASFIFSYFVCLIHPFNFVFIHFLSVYTEFRIFFRSYSEKTLFIYLFF